MRSVFGARAVPRAESRTTVDSTCPGGLHYADTCTIIITKPVSGRGHRVNYGTTRYARIVMAGAL